MQRAELMTLLLSLPMPVKLVAGLDVPAVAAQTMLLKTLAPLVREQV